MNFKTFFLEQQDTGTVVLLPGGFRPPHKGHFEALKYLIRKTNAKQAKVFVGKKDRDGVTQKQSVDIWSIYKKYLPANIEIIPVIGADGAGREATPLSMTYDFIEHNQNNYTKFFVGAGEEDISRFNGLQSNKAKYNNVSIVAVPPQFERISGTAVRSNMHSGGKVNSFIPDEARENSVAIQKILAV